MSCDVLGTWGMEVLPSGGSNALNHGSPILILTLAENAHAFIPRHCLASVAPAGLGRHQYPGRHAERARGMDGGVAHRNDKIETSDEANRAVIVLMLDQTREMLDADAGRLLELAHLLRGLVGVLQRVPFRIDGAQQRLPLDERDRAQIGARLSDAAAP